MNTIKLAVAFAALLVCGLTLPSSLQARQTIEDGTIEVAGSIGLNSGVDLRHDAEDTKWSVGATGGYAIRSNLLIVAEFMRTHLLSPSIFTLPPPSTARFELSMSMLELTVGLQYQIPIKDSKILPFLGFGAGMARNQRSVNIIDRGLSDTGASNDFIGNWGIGARIHLSSNWGLRPEFKVVHTALGDTWVRTTVGVFYQFGR